jgi:hypothetical protein
MWGTIDRLRWSYWWQRFRGGDGGSSEVTLGGAGARSAGRSRVVLSTRLFVLVFAIGSVALTPVASRASWSGSNGRIAFGATRKGKAIILTMSAHGKQVRS